MELVPVRSVTKEVNRSVTLPEVLEILLHHISSVEEVHEDPLPPKVQSGIENAAPIDVAGDPAVLGFQVLC